MGIAKTLRPFRAKNAMLLPAPTTARISCVPNVCYYTYSILKCLFWLIMICTFLYVIPPWKLREIFSMGWTFVTKSSQVVGTIVSSEESAKKFMKHLGKSTSLLYDKFSQDISNEIPVLG